MQIIRQYKSRTSLSLNHHAGTHLFPFLVISIVKRECPSIRKRTDVFPSRTHLDLPSFGYRGYI